MKCCGKKIINSSRKCYICLKIYDKYGNVIRDMKNDPSERQHYINSRWIPTMRTIKTKERKIVKSEVVAVIAGDPPYATRATQMFQERFYSIKGIWTQTTAKRP